MPSDEEAPLPVYWMLNSGEFLCGEYLEALVLLPVRDSRCCGSLGLLGQSCRGAAWPVSFGEEKRQVEALNPAVMGWARGQEQTPGSGRWGLRL